MTILDDKKVVTFTGRSDLGLFPKTEDLIPINSILQLSNCIGEVKREADTFNIRQMAINIGRLIGSMNFNSLNLFSEYSPALNLLNLFKDKRENVIPPVKNAFVGIGCVQDEGDTCRLGFAADPVSYYQGLVGGTPNDLDTPCANGNCPGFSGATDRYLLISPTCTLENSRYTTGIRFPLPDDLYVNSGPIEGGTTQIRNWIELFSIAENKMFNGLAARTVFDGSNQDIVDFTVESTRTGTLFSSTILSTSTDGLVVLPNKTTPLIERIEPPLYGLFEGHIETEICTIFSYPTMTIPAGVSGINVDDIIQIESSGYYFVTSVSIPFTQITVERLVTASTETAPFNIQVNPIEFRNITSGVRQSSSFSMTKEQLQTTIIGENILSANITSLSEIAKLTGPFIFEISLRSNGTDKFTVGETIEGGTSGATATVFSDDGIVIKVYGITGIFSVSETLTGAISLTTAQLDVINTQITADESVLVLDINNDIEFPGVLLIDSEQMSFGAIINNKTIGLTRAFNDTVATTHNDDVTVFLKFNAGEDFEINSQKNGILILNGGSLYNQVGNFVLQIDLEYYTNQILLTRDIELDHTDMTIIDPSFKLIYTHISVADILSALYKDMYSHFDGYIHVPAEQVCRTVAGDSSLCCNDLQELQITGLSSSISGMQRTVQFTLDMSALGGESPKSVIIDWGDGEIYYKGKLGFDLSYENQSELTYKGLKGSSSSGLIIIEDEIIGYSNKTLTTLTTLSRGKEASIRTNHEAPAEIRSIFLGKTLFITRTYPDTNTRNVTFTVKSEPLNCVLTLVQEL